TEWIARDWQLEPADLPPDTYPLLRELTDKLSLVSGYDLRVFDANGRLYLSSPNATDEAELPYSLRHLTLVNDNRFIYNHPDSSRLFSFIYLGTNPVDAQFLEISIEKEDIYAMIA
ncbi:hypothetical protein RZS08_52950, partial [Arthrospira platensis SPKY1]|nr:hypothetical protein [Arthrospira platensis SPKY1]